MSQRESFEKISRLLAPFIIEFIGSFFLTTSIAFNLINFTRSENVFELQAAIGIGGTLLACVYAGGHISGAHYNPSVTIAVWLSRRNKISTLDAGLYIVIQILASFIAGLFQWAILEETFRITPGAHIPALGAIIVEWFWTFLLGTVVLQAATTKPQAGNSFFGLAIGFTVLSGIATAGYVSGGAFNPAILLGLHFVDCIAHGDISRMEYTYIYIIGGVLGGLCAGALFHITNRAEYTEGTEQISLYSADATAIADIAATKRSKKHLKPGSQMADSYVDEGEYEEMDDHQRDYLLAK